MSDSPKRKPGRPPKPSAELYSAEVRVRLPPAQRDRWRAVAKARGVSLSDALREVMDRWAEGGP